MDGGTATNPHTGDYYIVSVALEALRLMVSIPGSEVIGWSIEVMVFGLRSSAKGA